MKYCPSAKLFSKSARFHAENRLQNLQKTVACRWNSLRLRPMLSRNSEQRKTEPRFSMSQYNEFDRSNCNGITFHQRFSFAKLLGERARMPQTHTPNRTHISLVASRSLTISQRPLNAMPCMPFVLVYVCDCARMSFCEWVLSQRI